MSIPAIGYTRVSTADQRDRGASIGEQYQRIEAWCSAKGVSLHRIYSDEGFSGADLDHRPSVSEAIDEACRLKATLVVYSLSRLSRSISDLLQISERLTKAGAELVSLVESWDTSTAAGRMVFKILAVFADFERDLTSERTAGILAGKRRNGEVYSGVTPYGFRRVGKTLVHEPDEQAQIRSWRRLRTLGWSYRRIAEALEFNEVPSRSGGRWHPETIKRILQREI